MKLVLLQTGKYLRRLGWYWLPWSVVLILQIPLAAVVTDLTVPSPELHSYLFITPILVWVMIFFGVSQTFHEDTLLDPAAFWQSRPLRQPKLLAAQFLAVGAAFVLLPALAITIALAPELSLKSALSVAGQKSLSLLAYVSILIALAAVTRNSRRYLQASLALVAGGVALVFFFGAVFPTFSPEVRHWVHSLVEPTLIFNPVRAALGAWLLPSAVTLAAGSLAVLQYLLRRTAAISLAGVAMILTFFPAVGIVAETLDWFWLRSVELLPESVTFEVPSQRHPITTTGRSSVLSFLNLEGPSSEFETIPVLSEGTARLADETFKASRSRGSSPAGQLARPALIQEAFGGAELLRDLSARPWVTMFPIPNRTWISQAGQEASYSGILNLYHYRYLKTASVPLQSDSELRHEGLKFKLVLLEPTETEVMLELRGLHQTSALLGSASRRRDPATGDPLYSMVLWNPMRHEVLPPAGLSATETTPDWLQAKLSADWLGVGHQSVKVSFNRGTRVTDSWLAEAELALVEKELVGKTAGEFTFPFKMPIPSRIIERKQPAHWGSGQPPASPKRKRQRRVSREKKLSAAALASARARFSANGATSPGKPHSALTLRSPTRLLAFT